LHKEGEEQKNDVQGLNSEPAFLNPFMGVYIIPSIFRPAVLVSLPFKRRLRKQQQQDKQLTNI
jgi:hypothetical protein